MPPPKLQDFGMPCLNEKELEEISCQLNAEITSWHKHPHLTRIQMVINSQLHIITVDKQATKKKGSHNPMSGPRFNFQAEKAIQEILETSFGQKPFDCQIKHLLASDSRLAGETFERVKRKILASRKANKNKMKKISPTPPSVAVLPWGARFVYQGREIEIFNSCPIDNLLTTFHLF